MNDEMTAGEIATLAFMLLSVSLGGVVGWLGGANIVAVVGGALIWGAASACLVILVPLSVAALGRLLAWLMGH